MIVSDENVQAALDYLNLQPHPLAVAEWRLLAAKNKREKIFAELYVQTSGAVRARECTVELQAAFQDAKTAEENAILELAHQKARRLWADKITDLYQTVSANARQAERIR